MSQLRLFICIKGNALYHIRAFPLSAFLKWVMVWMSVQLPPYLLFNTFCNHSVGIALSSAGSSENVGKMANWAFVVANWRACSIFAILFVFVAFVFQLNLSCLGTLQWCRTDRMFLAQSVVTVFVVMWQFYSTLTCFFLDWYHLKHGDSLFARWLMI